MPRDILAGGKSLGSFRGHGLSPDRVSRGPFRDLVHKSVSVTGTSDTGTSPSVCGHPLQPLAGQGVRARDPWKVEEQRWVRQTYLEIKKVVKSRVFTRPFLRSYTLSLPRTFVQL